MDLLPNTLIPLDGKTAIDSPILIAHMNTFHTEMKLEIERLYQLNMNKQREEIFKTMATLLQSNYKHVEEPNRIGHITNNLNKELSNKPCKKGRPKKKNNPWNHVISEESDSDS